VAQKSSNPNGKGAIMQFAERMERLGTETAFEVLSRAKALEAQGRKIIHLEIGEPDFDTPLFIREAAMQALKNGRTHYSPAAGILELRQAICEEVARRRGVAVRPENVVVTPGAKPIIYFPITALIEEGDEVIYPNPGFPIYESVIEFVDSKTIPLPLREEKNFRFDLTKLQKLISGRTRMIIINSPQNPTDNILKREDMHAIAEIAHSRNIIMLTDEVYKNIIYENEHASILSEPGMLDHTILLDGFSKTYAMTGWRLGFGVMPAPLAQKVEKLMINSNSCTATFIQDAGVTALRGPHEEIDAFVQEFKRRRDLMVEGLNQIKGVHCRKPHGAFYCFPNVSKVPLGSKQLADHLLNEAGVAVLSGTAFGKFGEGYLRLSYANSIENIQAALQKMKRTIAAL
jgi:aspartate/methionine/tyrosine aminotransferase